MVIELLIFIVVIFFKSLAPDGRRRSFHIGWIDDLVVVVEEENAIVEL